MYVCSTIFSTFAIVFYSLVYIPQFHILYKTKNSQGINLTMMCILVQLDYFALLSNIILDLPLNEIVIGWYNAIVSGSLTYYISYYRSNHNILFKYVLLLNIYNFIGSVYYEYYYHIHHLKNKVNTSLDNNYYIFGTIITWITVIGALASRFLQIIQNYNTKSTEGLSYLMYIFNITANICYGISIVVYKYDYIYIIKNLPWYIFIFFAVSLDSFVLYQFKLYNITKLYNKIAEIEAGIETETETEISIQHTFPANNNDIYTIKFEDDKLPLFNKNISIKEEIINKDEFVSIKL